MGVVECDNMLMLLALPNKMEHKARHIITKELMRGFAVCLFFLLFVIAMFIAGLLSRCGCLSAWRADRLQSVAHYRWRCVGGVYER